MQTKHDMRAILGEDFFKEEVRCDYLIPAYMKKNWAIQLDLYLVVADICEKYGLKYFFTFGGLLGAIRHNGFIPWDDDLDIGMLRKDYEEFIKVAPHELSSPYFLRTPFSDPTCLYPVICLVNSDTTFIPKLFRRNGFNMGVPIDIFPIDYCSIDKVEEERKEILKYFLQCTNFMKRNCKGLNERQKRDLVTYYVDDPYQSFNNLHGLASNPADEGSDYMTIYNAITREPLKHVYPSSAFADSISHRFENMDVKIPVGWKDVLNATFGDYMQFPPVEERGSKNNQIFFDPDHPYTYYTAMDDLSLENAIGVTL